MPDEQETQLIEQGRWEEPDDKPPEPPELKDILFTQQVLNLNLAEYLEDTELSKIGEQVHLDYEIDKRSCAEWWVRTEPAIDLAMLTLEKKDEDWRAAVKFPLLTVAALQFAARAFPNIVKGKDIVKGKIIGKDVLLTSKGEEIQGGKTTIKNRISEHMSWQLSEQMEEWVEDLDKGLLCLPIVGEEWKKTYFCPVLKRNMSVRVPSSNMVINYWAKSPDTASRLTEKIDWYPNEIEEKKRSGYILDVDIPVDGGVGDKKDSMDEDAPVRFLEQHRWLDLDKDGYKESYVVTIHKSSKKVVRIYHRYDLKNVERGEDGRVARIKPVSYYTQTVFYHSPDGGSRGMGLGNLMRPINESINKTLNNLIDSGTLNSNPCGFIGKMIGHDRKFGGKILLKLGEWFKTNFTGDDLRKAIVPLPTKEPSNVLYLLLGMLIDAGKQLGISELLSGESPGANTQPTTILALIEQGLKVFSAVYLRIHRGLKSEFKKLYRLNSIYLDEKEYFTVLDNQKAIGKIDYNIEGIDVIPVSNPNEISDMQKMLRAETLKTLLGQGFKDQAIRKRYLELIAEMTGIENVQEFMLTDEDLKRIPPEIQLEMNKFELEKKKFEWEKFTGLYDNLKKQAMAAKAYAEAEAAELGPQLDEYKSRLDRELKEIEAFMKFELETMKAKKEANG